jgi:ferrous iron transport protein A
MMRHRGRWHRHGPTAAPEGDVVPLTALRAGQGGRVVSLDGGRWVMGRMTSLGFTPGAPVRVLQNRGHGPLIACVRDVRVALGRHQAQKIMVRRIA